MSNLLIFSLDGNTAFTSEQEFLHEQLTDWQIYYYRQAAPSFRTITSLILEKDIHFFLFAQNLSPSSLELIRNLRARFPLLTIIFYNSQMKSEEFAHLFLAGVDFCIIGDARQINLISTLQEQWANHWKRIPEHFFPEQIRPLSGRNLEIVRFIETKPLSFFNSYRIAEFFKYSDSHFRAEFKKAFKISFRVFKQKLLSHYESILLFEKKLKPKEIIEILNYTNISAFSRSFKSRHGYSWQTLIRQEEQL